MVQNGAIAAFLGSFAWMPCLTRCNSGLMMASWAVTLAMLDHNRLLARETRAVWQTLAHSLCSLGSRGSLWGWTEKDDAAS